ncbi:unnamed protein product [Hermetia illucens]|uniref:Uncharacterized protein n=1 Tax=Hermetia illucens TaxID=343691 RepID=A0A7R8UWP9_HERIL|nr:unnamed protein product [Hermetia illucens]
MLSSIFKCKWRPKQVKLTSLCHLYFKGSSRYFGKLFQVQITTFGLNVLVVLTRLDCVIQDLSPRALPRRRILESLSTSRPYIPYI